MTRTNSKALDEALYWVVRLDADNVTFDEKERFLEWLDMDPRHLALIREVETTWSGFDGLDNESRLDMKAYAFMPLPFWHPSRFGAWFKTIRGSHPLLVAWTGAVAMIFLVMTGIVTWRLYEVPPPEVYTTAAGEQKTLLLGDGTQIHMNTRSRLVVQISRTKRFVNFVEGEALFEVARHPDRPFYIDTGNGRVRVLGTKFNVFKKPSHQVTVTVVSGEVEVADELDTEYVGENWRRNLVSGQQMAYRDEGIVAEVSPANVEAATNWRRSVAVFDDLPLVDVIAELNRYSSRKIVLLDPSLQDMRIGGVFKLTDIPLAVRSLEAAAPVKVVSQENFIGLTALK